MPVSGKPYRWAPYQYSKYIKYSANSKSHNTRTHRSTLFLSLYIVKRGLPRNSCQFLWVVSANTEWAPIEMYEHTNGHPDCPFHADSSTGQINHRPTGESTIKPRLGPILRQSKQWNHQEHLPTINFQHEGWEHLFCIQIDLQHSLQTPLF